MKDGLRELKKQRQDSSQHLEALEIGRGRSPEDVRQFKAALDDAGIGHQMLSDIVEVLDPNWQAAVEALLRGYRHVVLLERESDRRDAWRIGEKLRYRHFVVPGAAARRAPMPAV